MTNTNLENGNENLNDIAFTGQSRTFNMTSFINGDVDGSLGMYIDSTTGNQTWIDSTTGNQTWIDYSNGTINTIDSLGQHLSGNILLGG